MKKKTASLTVVESKSRPENFYLRLTGANGEKLMFSELYPNKGAAKRARQDHLEALVEVLRNEPEPGYTVLHGTPDERVTQAAALLTEAGYIVELDAAEGD